MTKKTRRQYTDEFKNQIVQLYLNGKSKSELVKEYNLGMSSVCRWIDQHENSGSFNKMEVDILKQAALIIGRK